MTECETERELRSCGVDIEALNPQLKWDLGIGTLARMAETHWQRQEWRRRTPTRACRLDVLASMLRPRRIWQIIELTEEPDAAGRMVEVLEYMDTDGNICELKWQDGRELEQ